ncbi:hypothetical protein KY316_01230 [Candidatus Woesearchaeota archaeon]|nr:hypothetical protein [Candidatus Woesearchaeota archaeon]
MKKALIVFFLVAIVLLQSIAVSAITSAEAKQRWFEAKRDSRDAQGEYFQAKLQFAGNKSNDNRQAVVDSGKERLHAALNEAEAWLVWKDAEADENPFISEDLRDTIKDDVSKNLQKVEALREEVNGVTNQVELGVVFLKMAGKYVELLTDAARDSGKILVFAANEHLEAAEQIEEKVREMAQNAGNAAALAELDNAKEDLDDARSNIDKAEAAYNDVVLPGTPLMKFQEGNAYMRAAKEELRSAQRNIRQAYRRIVREE